MTLHPGQQAHKGRRALGRVVDPANHGILKRNAPPGLFKVPAAGRHELFQRIAFVDRHELIADGVGRRMQRYRKCQLQLKPGELVNPGNQSAGRQRNMAHTDIEPLRMCDDTQKK